MARITLMALAACLLAPTAAADFEVHEVNGPTDRVVPGETATIEVDLDIDCQSAWLHDPYVIDVTVSSDASVQGPTQLEVPRSECMAPDGVTEQFLSYNVSVPMTLPAYVDVPVNFTFTSSDHPLDPSQTHPGSTTLQPDGVPRIEVTPATANVTVEGEGNHTLTIGNTGNVAVAISFGGPTVQGLQLPDVPAIERGGQEAATIRLVPAGGWDSFTTELTVEAVDEEGKQAPPANVTIHWDRPPQEGGKDSPMPGLVLPLAYATWRRWTRG